MKCTNNRLVLLTAIFLIIISITGCAGFSYGAPYSVSSSPEEIQNDLFYPTFASDLCVVNTDISDSDFEIGDTASGGLFDLSGKRTIYARNVNARLHPASLTKVMTALVALENASLDQVLVAGSDVYVTESGAQKIGLKEGDRMTLDQALRILLVYSANDVANMIAANIGGSIDNFVNMMNTKAREIGATNSHFMNPHGLTADEHYVTAYDMYLIFNAAMEYDTFNEIINMTEYNTNYTRAGGDTVEVSISNTNAFLRGDRQAPSGVTVIGGKTGTTTAAGHCLILLARDVNGSPYIAVILRDIDNDSLYTDMIGLLAEIVN